MAKLFDAPPDATISFPIVKKGWTPDGDLVVYGKATDGSVDSDSQIVDPEWSGKALTEWLKTGGNVRVQHSPQLYPAGKGIDVEIGKDGAHWVRALIVEPTAQKLVDKGVLQAYSVGIAKPQIVHDMKARGGRIVGGQIAELSLVDRPANKNCGITLVKSDTNGAAHVINKMFGHVDDDINDDDPIEDEVPDTIEKSAAAPAPADDNITATVTFTPMDLAKILGKGKKPPAVGDADPTNDGGFPKDDDEMSDKDDVGGGKEDATSPQPKGKDLDEDDKGRFGKKSEDHDGGPFVEKRDVSQDERERLADQNKALPDGSFPIASRSDLQNAVQAVGRAKNYGQAKSHIKRRAAALGATDVLPDSWKSEEDPEVTKTDKTPDIPNAAPAFGSKKKSCPGCGKMNKAKAKFCNKCGEKMTEPDVTKAETPASASGARAKTMEPVPAHREPDGPQMESFEEDVKLPEPANDERPSTNVPGSDWDAAPPARPRSNEGTSLKSDAPDELKRLHDLTCAAFSVKSINNAYPHLPSFGAAINVEFWRNEALKAVGTDLEKAHDALTRARAAELLKEVGVEELTDARQELHKSFTEMYPDVTPPTPTELDPGRYTRPYLSGGHARNSPGATADTAPKPRANEIQASSYNRGPLTAGHERPSPGNKGDNAPVMSGAAVGAFYGSAARAAAMNAMISLHDHVAGNYPALCAMATGAPSRAVGKTEETTDTDEQVVNKTTEPTLNKAAVAGAGAITPDLIKSAVAEALAERDAQVTELQKRIAELEHLPHPFESAYRGLGVLNKSADTVVPEDAMSDIQKAAKQRNDALFGYLQTRSVYAPSPAEREQARIALQQMMNE